MKKKKLQDIGKFLDPLYKKGKPFIIKEEDYLWIYTIIGIFADKNGIIYFNGEPIYFDTLETKVKGKKLACSKCGGQTGKIEFHTVDGEIKPYHPGCLPNTTNK